MEVVLPIRSDILLIVMRQKNNKFHGKGVHKHSNGIIIDGTWKEGKPNGKVRIKNHVSGPSGWHKVHWHKVQWHKVPGTRLPFQKLVGRSVALQKYVKSSRGVKKSCVWDVQAHCRTV